MLGLRLFPRKSWRRLILSGSALSVFLFFVFTLTPIIQPLPPYTGEHDVGVLDVETPVERRVIYNATIKETGEPAFEVGIHLLNNMSLLFEHSLHVSDLTITRRHGNTFSLFITVRCVPYVPTTLFSVPLSPDDPLADHLGHHLVLSLNSTSSDSAATASPPMASSADIANWYRLRSPHAHLLATAPSTCDRDIMGSRLKYCHSWRC
jgi:hypothetical protein